MKPIDTNEILGNVDFCDEKKLFSQGENFFIIHIHPHTPISKHLSMGATNVLS